MTKEKTNFTYHRVDVGLDVHKHAAVFLNGVYVRMINFFSRTIKDCSRLIFLPKGRNNYLFNHRGL